MKFNENMEFYTMIYMLMLEDNQHCFLSCPITTQMLIIFLNRHASLCVYSILMEQRMKNTFLFNIIAVLKQSSHAVHASVSAELTTTALKTLSAAGVSEGGAK